MGGRQAHGGERARVRLPDEGDTTDDSEGSVDASAVRPWYRRRPLDDMAPPPPENLPSRRAASRGRPRGPLHYTRENSQKEIRARESTQHSWLGGNTLQISARVDQMDCNPRVHSDGRGRQCSFTVSTSARFKAAKEVATLGGKYRGNPAIKGQFSLQASQTHWNP